jgi:hypothetical protein
MPAVTAQSMQGDANTAITAAGTTIATATDLTNVVNIITSGADGTGVQLDTGVVGDSQLVYNATATSKKVYPSSATAGINQIPVGTAHVLAPYTSCQYFVASATQHIGFLSA